MVFNPHITTILNKARQQALEDYSEYVLLEHIFEVVISEDCIIQYLFDKVSSVEKMKSDVRKFLINSCTGNSGMGEMVLTQMVERVINKVNDDLTTKKFNDNIESYNYTLQQLLIHSSLEDGSYVQYVLNKYGYNVEYNNDPKITSTSDMFNTISSTMAGAIFSSMLNPTNIRVIPSQNATQQKATQQKASVISTLCTNFTEMAATGKIMPAIGRDYEIQIIKETMGRKCKPNILLVGKPGIGKTAVVEGLAYSLLHDDAHPEFKLNTVYSLEVSNIIAGTRYRGEMEERITNLVSELKKQPNAILFIDEIHQLIGGGTSADSPLDVANILKPALSRGEIKVIGSTTDEEFRKFFEKDKAFTRRFFKLNMDEPTLDETKVIITNLVPRFEEFYNVQYSEDAIASILTLSNKYMKNKVNPDKSIDLLDMSGAYVNVSPRKLRIVNKEDVITQVSRLTKLTNESLQGDIEDLSQLNDKLKQSIYGQDKALDTITDALIVSRLGLRDENKTQVSLLFRGPSGVGKSATCIELSKLLGIPLIRFDMSEYHEEHSISKLIGAPAGYVGYRDGDSGSGLLVNAIEENPSCILLLDEVEKAHRNVLNIFLQVMDNGELSSSSGKKVSFKNVILIMTSNIGAVEETKHSIGFGMGSSNNTDRGEDETNNFFTPEFRNRLDATVRFNNIDKGLMIDVVKKFINILRVTLEGKQLTLNVSDDVIDYIGDMALKENLGARPVTRVIHSKIKVPLSKLMLNTNNKIFNVSVVNNDIVVGV